MTWRSITRDDLAALAGLAAECHRVDGGLAFMHDAENLLERYFPDRPGAAIAAFTKGGKMAACTAVQRTSDGDAERVVIVGEVRPDMRERGIGTYLMHWSQAQAQMLFSAESANKRLLQIATESLTDPAGRLYASFGFEQVHESLVMQRDLHRPLTDRPLPADITFTTWQPDLAEQFYQAYQPAFRDRPGFPGWSAEEWISNVLDNDFKPEWSFLACSSGVPAGFVIGTIDLTTDPPGGFVWQTGVVPDQRRRGICSALMVASLRQMHAAGANWAQLVVHINNPGAIRTYEKLGFVTAGRRARYEKIVLD